MPVHVINEGSAVLQSGEMDTSLVLPATSGAGIEIDISSPSFGWRDILGAAAAAVGNDRPHFVQVPRGLLRGLGHTAGVAAKLAGQAAMFNSGKLRELLHEDWSVAETTLFKPAQPPRHLLGAGFASTAAWYVESGWL